MTIPPRHTDNSLELANLPSGSLDRYPIITRRDPRFPHVHVLGATGTNKSSMGLASLIEQLDSFGVASLVFVDSKGDLPELYHVAQAAVQAFRPKH